METSILTNENGVRKMSWGGVAAGVAIALSVEVTLNFLGIGLGFTSLNLSADRLIKIGTGSVIWLAVSGIISMGFGGWVAGTVSNYSGIKTRMLNGLLAWSFATLIIVTAATTTTGTMISGLSGIVKNSISAISEKKVLSAVAQYAKSSASTAILNKATESKAVNEASNNLGSASIIISIAFILSAISAMLGAFWSMPKRNQIERR